MTITHLLLDIEGTTCPVQFVAEVLFPYARNQLSSYLHNHATDPGVQALIAEVQQAWQLDRDPAAIALKGEQEPTSKISAVAAYLQGLIDRDIKLSPLKDLQGRIWQAGYAKGSLVAPLFDDVPSALRRWHTGGMVLGVYSSGSIPAQQLLYEHTVAGDLRHLFSHWYDTRTGAKHAASSYTAIAQAMRTNTGQVLFVSDSVAELEAASTAGMAVLFSDREGNPARESGRFERISDYSLLNPSDVAQPF